jgi:hypothetical protein
VFTLAPTIYNLDSAEFTTAAATGGIVRATGYPLYLMLGRVWSWIPIGDVGYRMNLFSAFNGALTIALAERILRRLNVGPWATWGALGLLATAPMFWALSLVAEVYTLHTALMAAMILLLLRWSEAPTPHRLGLVALVTGLSGGNHAATTLLVPGLAWYVLTTVRQQSVPLRAWLPAIALGLAGLGVYLYLPLRYSTMPPFNYAGHYDGSGSFVPVNLQTPAGLWWLISGQTFSSSIWAYSGTELIHQVYQYIVQLWRTFFAIGIGPGLLGMALLLRRDRRVGGMLLLIFIANAGFYIDYSVADKDTMFLPTYLVWAIWAGTGYQSLLDWIHQNAPSASQPWGTGLWGTKLMYGVIAGITLIALVWNWPLADLSDDWSTRTQTQELLDQLEPNALFLGWWDTVPAIQYLQLVERQRPDVQAINRFLIASDDMLQLIKDQVNERPVYVDAPNEGILKIVEAESNGPVYRLEPKNAKQKTRTTGW